MNEDQMIYGSWIIRCDRHYHHFRPFFALSPLWQPGKWKFWKTEKYTLTYNHFTHVHHKWQSYEVRFLRYVVWQTIFFFVILSQFLPFYPLMILKIKILKNEKNVCKCYPFTNVYHKWRSYDIWFLKYKVQQTDISVILGHFLPFYPLTTWEIKILRN